MTFISVANVGSGYGVHDALIVTAPPVGPVEAVGAPTS